MKTSWKRWWRADHDQWGWICNLGDDSQGFCCYWHSGSRIRLVCFTVWQETTDHNRAVAIGMCTLYSISKTRVRGSLCLYLVKVLKIEGRLSYWIYWGRARLWERDKSLMKPPYVSSAVNNFLTGWQCRDSTKLLGQSSDTYSTATVYGDVTSF